MFLTRLGFGSKVVVTGDVTQVDLPRDQASGLIQVQEILGGRRRHRLRPLRAPGRRPAQARPADRRGLPRARRGDRNRTAQVAPDARGRGRQPERRRGRRGAAVELACRVLARRGHRRRRARAGVRRRPTRCATLKREHLGIDEATDVLSFPIDGRDELPRGRAARARRRRALPAGRRRASGARRSSTGCCTCSATTTATRWRRESAALRDELAARSPDDLRLFNYAFEGIIHVLRTQRNMRIHFLVAVVVLVARARRRRLEDRADRAADLDHVRAHRRDDQHGDRGRDRRRDDARSTRWRSSRRTSPRARC